MISKEDLERFLSTEEGASWLNEQKSGLLTKKDELLGKLTASQEALKEYKSLGDVNEIKKTIDSVREAQVTARNNDAEAKEVFLNEQIEKYKSDFTTLQSTLVSDKVNNELSKAIASAKGEMDIVLPLLAQRVKGEYVDGEVSINVLDGDKVMHKDGERMTVADLVSDMKAKHPNLFEVSASGSGTRPGQVASNAPSTYDFNDGDFNMTKAAERTKKNSSYESVTKRFGWRQ